MNAPQFPNDGACYQTDEHGFFPGTEKPTHPDVLYIKRRYCAWCPVIAECLQYALDTQSDWGIFGGTTGEERHPMRKPKRTRFAPVATKRKTNK
jgi:WhiB family transcriptional regulator, redox-sensing transcriptional regulator